MSREANILKEKQLMAAEVYQNRAKRTPYQSLYEHPEGEYANSFGEAVVFLTADAFVLLSPLESG
jgi:hypothetical protein